MGAVRCVAVWIVLTMMQLSFLCEPLEKQDKQGINITPSVCLMCCFITRLNDLNKKNAFLFRFDLKLLLAVISTRDRSLFKFVQKPKPSIKHNWVHVSNTFYSCPITLTHCYMCLHITKGCNKELRGGSFLQIPHFFFACSEHHQQPQTFQLNFAVVLSRNHVILAK